MLEVVRPNSHFRCVGKCLILKLPWGKRCAFLLSKGGVKVLVVDERLSNIWFSDFSTENISLIRKACFPNHLFTNQLTNSI